MPDPVNHIRVWCLSLARADTGASVFDWFSRPITELSEWADIITTVERQRKRRK